MQFTRSLRRTFALAACSIVGLIGASAATAQGTTASLSDSGMHIDSKVPSAGATDTGELILPETMPPPTEAARPGVQMTLSDRTGFTWSAPPSAAPTADADRVRNHPLPQLSGNVQIPFEQIAMGHMGRRPLVDQADGNPLPPRSSRIQVFPTESGSNAGVHPASLHGVADRPDAPLTAPPSTPSRVGRQERDYFHGQEAQPLAASGPELSAAVAGVAGPLPQMREMFSFSTASTNPIQAVAARQPPPAGLPAMLKISVDGPRSVSIGETAAFTVTTENVGHQPALDVYLVVDQGRDVRIVSADPAPAEQNARGVKIFLGSLEGGALRAVSVQVTAQQAGPVRLRCRTQSRQDPSEQDPRSAESTAPTAEPPASARR